MLFAQYEYLCVAYNTLEPIIMGRYRLKYLFTGLFMVYSCTLGRPFNVCLVSVVVSVMDSHKYDRGSSPGQGNHIHVRYALNSIQFISDKSFTELALYLWDLYFTYKFQR